MPLVLVDNIHPTNHLVMGAYNPLHPQNSTSIQLVIYAWFHARFRFVIKDNERLDFSKRSPNQIPWAAPNSLRCDSTFFALPT